MIPYIERTERIIGEIKQIETVEKGKLKELILELAKHLADGIETKRPEILNKLKVVLATDTKRPRGQDEITVNMVSLLIKKLKTQHFPSISHSWIEKVLPDEYKEHREERVVTPKMILPDNISDANLLQIAPELKKRLRKIENLGPAKEIKVKDTIEEMKEQKFKCPVADELIKLAVKCENEHDLEHNHDYCNQTAKTVRIARDKRFATTFSRYQAIVIEAEHTRSLADLAGSEVEVLKRWEVHDNEKACRECIDLNHCRASKCEHICHDFKKPMTTKGIKWAERETQELSNLKKKFDRLYEDSDDMCDMMKIVFTNDALTMSQGDKKSLMASHIKKDDCDKCLYFTSEHPDFFKEHLQ